MLRLICNSFVLFKRHVKRKLWDSNLARHEGVTVYNNRHIRSGLPPSGKIRENFDLLESQRKSGNFNIFCRESGKVGENDLADVTQSLSLISRHISVTIQWFQVQNFSSLCSGFHAIPIRSVSWGEGKSGKGKSAPKKSGNSNWADWWQPCSMKCTKGVWFLSHT